MVVSMLCRLSRYVQMSELYADYCAKATDTIMLNFVQFIHLIYEANISTADISFGKIADCKLSALVTQFYWNKGS